DPGRDARAARRGRADALRRAPPGGRSRAGGADGVGGGQDRRQRAHHALRRLQLRRAGGDRRRRGALPGRQRGGLREAALRAGDARAVAPEPQDRRAAALELPAVAVRVLGAALHRRAVAGLLARGPRGRAGGLRGALPALRRALMASGPRSESRSRSRSRSRRRRPRRGTSDLFARILIAIPAIAFAVFIIAAGGWIFTVGAVLLGLLCMHELFRMYEGVRPVKLAGFAALIGLGV